MILSSHWRFSPGPKAVALMVLLSPLVGCGRNEAQTYRVPKEAKKSTLPNGWEETPRGEMRVASFRARGEGGKTADISVIPLPGMAGSDLANVNRWREQVGLSPVPEADIAKSAQAVEVGGEKGQIYDLAGKNPASGDPTRIVAAIVRKDGSAWFFKMNGDDALVAKQKPAFLEYLKTFNWQSSASEPVASTDSQLPPSHPPIGNLPATGQGASPDSGLPPSHPPIGNLAASGQGAPAVAPAGGPQKPQWQVPSGWKEIDGGPFLISKFTTSSGDAAVNVSMSAGTGGGLSANVNRWRGQLGLGDLSNDQLADQATSVDIPGGKATFVDMAGTDAKNGQKARLIAAVVPRGQQTWFYKLMGAPATVEANKETFMNFVKGVKYN